ncbi:hypothetical protein Nepgr_021988 [Nepenthes gracilis]|uniref:Remorin C-terminal domain-containing protein n=1 Tax=Nepenthes gracilis TaxID=150966 RepID=A0AAD3T0Z6_NEPGR|nr:hypothetical protein Nepgr_021988 [Nepenthes gracilis]
MPNAHRATAHTTGNRHEDQQEDNQFRDIHALTPPHPPPVDRQRRSLSMGSEANSGENFTTISREFNALVLAGSVINTTNGHENDGGNNGSGANLGRIGEDEAAPEEMNPLDIVPDNNPLDPVPSPRATSRSGSAMVGHGEVSMQSVKKEEVEAKISAWQNAKISKINNRFKREDAVIGGWEGDQVQKATSWMKKFERKLEEKRARAMEKMQNDIAKAHRKAQEKRASAEAKRGTKVASILEMANLMRAVGSAPTKRSYF